MQRRRFVQALATLPAVGSGLRPAQSDAAAAAPAAPPAAKLAGIGACDWTLRLTANPDSLDLAKKIGLDGVQVDFGSPAPGKDTLPLHSEALQDAFLARAETTGVAVPSLALAVLNQIAYKKEPMAEQWVLDSVKVARRMKTSVVLLAFFSQGDLRDDESGFQETVNRLKRLAPLAEEAGITYGIESWLKVADLERLLNAVNSPRILAYYDVGNMQKEGEDIHAAIRQLGRERICEVHAKDYDDLYGRGTMDFAKVGTSLAAIDYRGWMHMEGIKTPNGVEQDMQFDLRHLQSIFQPERFSKPPPS
jgi:sugar phosphate isomerase/epimerase